MAFFFIFILVTFLQLSVKFSEPTIHVDLKLLCFAGKSDDLTNDGCNKTSDLVVCFGELLIDFVPTVGGVSLAEAPAFKKAPGGAPANVAVGISRLGGSSAFIGKVYIYVSLFRWLFGFLLLCARFSSLICSNLHIKIFVVC